MPNSFANLGALTGPWSAATAGAVYDLITAAQATGSFTAAGFSSYILGGKIAEPPVSATANPWRSQVALTQLVMTWGTGTDPATGALADNFEAQWKNIAAAANGGAAANFFNFIWCGSRSQDELFDAFFSSNAAKLKAIKSAADPAGRLTTFCDIP